ncbi:MAG: hypothetical protein CMI67_23680 [Pelagibaca sp.]|nr:hypothetical protein [Pelagibaca sp.]
MPVFRQTSSDIPDWCELRGFAPVDLGAGETVKLERGGPQEIIVATHGTMQVDWGHGARQIAEGQSIALPGDAAGYTLRAVTRAAYVMRLWGSWGGRIGGMGIFSVQPNAAGKNIGDPVDYPKLTGVDRHYHDYDEYWIVLDGSGTARVGADAVPMRRGDCVATGTGHHHDISQVNGAFRAIYLETTLRREERPGHLWEHTHGPADPDPDRT